MAAQGRQVSVGGPLVILRQSQCSRECGLSGEAHQGAQWPGVQQNSLVHLPES